MILLGDFGGVNDGIIIESSGCKKNVCTRRTRSSNVWNWNYINDQIFYAVGEDMNPIPPDLIMFFHLFILVFLGTECIL